MSDTRHAGQTPAARRDSRGRRIGRNPWREHVTDTWFSANQAWWLRLEAETHLYDTEVHEWRALPGNRRPNLGDFMVALSPGWSRPELAAAA